MAREPAIGDYAHHVEVFDVDHFVLAHQRQSLLVTDRSPSIATTRTRLLRDLLPLLNPPPREDG
jgi:hypothetical protein